MALVSCPDCSREISDAAPACVGCGRPMAVRESRGRQVEVRNPVATGAKIGAGIFVVLPLLLLALLVGGVFASIVPQVFVAYATIIGGLGLVVHLLVRAGRI